MLDNPWVILIFLSLKSDTFLFEQCPFYAHSRASGSGKSSKKVLQTIADHTEKS